MTAEPNTTTSPRVDAALVDRVEHIPPIAAGVAGAIGTIVLIGWVIGSPIMKSLGQPIPMNPTTAVALLLSAASLWLLGPRETPEPWRAVGRACGLLAGAVG